MQPLGLMATKIRLKDELLAGISLSGADICFHL